MRALTPHEHVILAAVDGAELPLDVAHIALVMEREGLIETQRENRTLYIGRTEAGRRALRVHAAYLASLG